MSDLYGPYRILRTLAARNQSRIDLVENTEKSDRREVLKRIVIVPGNEDNRELIAAEDEGARLQKEAHIRNPHIIDVYAQGQLNEYFFVSMEFVDGQNLEEYMKSGPSPLHPSFSASLARELCLQAATLHEFKLTVDGKSRAFLHNDIKPSNIQIRSKDNQIRLIDFGAAKALSFSKNFTRNDFASVAYCSPERLKNGVSDIQTDLWSIAVVLYEMVAGGLPYRASSNQQLEALIVSGAPPALLADTCPANLRNIIYKALSSDPAKRYPNATEFGEDLRRFSEGLAVSAEPAPLAGNPTVKVNNPTRKVDFVRPPAPTASTGFNPRPASYGVEPPQKPRTFVLPLDPIRAAFVRRPIWYGIRLAAGLFFLWLVISMFTARSQARTFYTNVAREDFPSMSVAAIEQQYNELQNIRDSAMGKFFVYTSNLRSSVKPRLMETAERPINAYRTDQYHPPSSADWPRARACLEFALEIDSGDKLAQAELDIVDGHVATLKRDYTVARQKFDEATRLAPDSPDSWIGLAFLDAYVDHNLQALEVDQNREQQHHYLPVQREAAQRGDVSMYLGRKSVTASLTWRRKGSIPEETHFLQEADSEFAQAAQAYQGSRNSFQTEANVEEIYNRRTWISARLAELNKPAAASYVGGNK